MRYYSTQRPVGPGTYPSNYRVENVHNFDRRIFCKDIGREAWGYIDFADLLPAKVARQWELILAVPVPRLGPAENGGNV